jgi:RNase H-like domain found in reverse transcriptase
MTLRLSKCKFANSKVRFIGHEIGSGTRSVIQSKVEAIKIIPEPHNKKLLRSFLGMCAFYRVYIPHYSEIALPLTELTKNRQSNNISFNETQRAAFLELKDKLCKSTTLYSPKSDRPFIVRTDASDYAVGACVAQIDDEGQERPIAFASAKLTEVQCRWSTIEKEAYAVIFALQRFDIIIFGAVIHLYTDNNPLKYLAACVPKSAKLTRWSLSLTRYDIQVNHIHGKDNVTADCLSRC